MHAVPHVSSVTSPSRTASIYRALKVNTVVRPAASTPAAPAATPQGVSVGVLMSVNQPSSNNVLASSDYETLRLALESNNLAAAQQAYVRLQSDILLTYSARSTMADGAAGSGQLNIAA